MKKDFQQMQEFFMHQLRLYHYPMGIHFFYQHEELEKFKERAEYQIPAKPLTFCQWQIAARMKGFTILGEKEQLGCQNARYCFGWKDFNEQEIASHRKYTIDDQQAERFVRSKPRLSPGLLAIAVAPLGQAAQLPCIDTIHFYCDNMQAYHLAVDYMAATNTHPLQSQITINSSTCGGNVHSFQSQQFNMLPACAGSYNAGKTERGEINVIFPGSQLLALYNRLQERVAKTSASITRPGDGFPGADICKNCSIIAFKKPSIKGNLP